MKAGKQFMLLNIIRRMWYNTSVVTCTHRCEKEAVNESKQ